MWWWRWNDQSKISECSKLAQKSMSLDTTAGRGDLIHWEFYKKFKFNHTNKWYMHNPEFILEKETHKPFWNSEIQTDHLISVRWPDLVIVNNNNKKKTLPNRRLCCPGKPQSKIKYQDLARELKKLWNTKVTGVWIVIGSLGTIPKVFIKGREHLEIRGQIETI